MSEEEQEEAVPSADMSVAIVGRQVKLSYSKTVQVNDFEPHTMQAEVAWTMEAGTGEELIDEIRSESLVLRSAVLEQLEIPIEISDDGIISLPRSPGKKKRGNDDSGGSKRSNRGSSKGGRSSSSRKSFKATDEDWEDLLDNPDDWYDNRDSKPSERSPDFRNKEDKDRVMWLNSAPDWFDEDELD